MEHLFNDLIKDIIFTSDLKDDSNNFLIRHNRHKIAEHSLRVAQKAKELARQYGVNENDAEIAGLLHDVAGVYPYDKRIDISKLLKLDILPKEEEFPMILHQKISAVMAQQIFNIQSYEILNAIGCHTTLRSGSSIMDKILFIADKIEWDQEGLPPYIDDIKSAVNISLEAAAYTYPNYLMCNGSKLKVIHPWLIEAYKELKNKSTGNMIIEYAVESDYDYIRQNDRHIVSTLIMPKIAGKEIIIIRDKENKNIGWLRYNYFWDNTPFMNMLYLQEKYRSKGLGKNLVEFWEADMKLRGYELVMTSTLSNEQAQRFYRELGYKDAGSLLLENEPLEIIFTKKL